MNRKKMGDQYTQILDQPLAYEYQRALDILCKSLEAFEGYVNKTGRGINSQIYGTGRWIKDYSGSVWDFQETFLIHLMIVGASFNDKGMTFPVREFVKKQFYKWVSHMGINAENCPRDLAHFLIATSDVLDGNNKKVVKENNQNLESGSEKPSIKVHNEMFFEYQKHINEVEEKKASFGRKSLDEKPIQGLEGDEEQGKNIFEEIEKKYRYEHNHYYLFSPYNEEQQQNSDEMVSKTQDDSSNSPSQRQQKSSNLTKNIFVSFSILGGSLLGFTLIWFYIKNRKVKIGRK